MLIAYIFSALAINITPGPAMLFVMQQSLRQGIKAGVVAAIGVEVGVIIYVFLTALGLGFFFKNNPFIYQLIQLLGIGYLIFLSISIWPKQKPIRLEEEKQLQPQTNQSQKNIFLKGVLVNLTNPKIAIFFMSFIPQYLPAQASTQQFIMYGLVLPIGGLVVNLLVGIYAQKIQKWLNRTIWFSYLPPVLFLIIATTSLINLLVPSN
jgi:threonine/homoserine/homoserine lactone efflux protein